MSIFKKVSYAPNDEFEKTAHRQVSNNAAEWAKDAVEYFYDQFPQYQTAGVFPKFKSKDPNKGYAVGTLRVGEFILPIIIKNFQIQPFDIAVSPNQQVIPFNNEVVNMLLAKANAFSSLDQRTPDALADLTRLDRALAYASSIPSPTMAYNGVPAYYGVKMSSFIDKLAEEGCIRKIDKARIPDCLSKNAEIDVLFKTKPHLADVLSKVAKLKADDDFDLVKEASEVLERDIHYVYKTDDGHDEVITGSSMVDDPVRIALDTHQATKLAKVACVPATKIASPVFPEHLRECFILKMANGDHLAFDKYGRYSRINSRDDVAYTITNDDIEKCSSLPSAGDYGIFIVKMGESYVPITDMLHIDRVNGGTTGAVLELAVHSDMGKIAKLSVLNMDRVALTKVAGSDSFIPGDALFIKLTKDGLVDLEKDAFFEAPHWQHSIYATGDDSYIWKSPVLSKYATRHGFKKGAQNLHETIWSLVQTGASKNTIDKLASLSAGDTLNIEEDLALPPTLDEYLQEKRAEYDVANTWTGTDLWIKLAAWMPDPQSVDAILSLNFLNPKTLPAYIAMLPQFEQTASNLSALLLNVRMGLTNMDEYPLEDSIKSLSKIIYTLTGLKNSKAIVAAK